jgi:predicted MFS family arabinose efflux permease
LIDVSPENQKGGGGISPGSQILVMALIKLLLNTARRFIYPFAPALSRGLDVPLSAVTSIIAVSQFNSILGIFSGPLADRLGYRITMGYGLLFLVAGMLLAGIFPVYQVVFSGLLIAGFGKTVFDPAIQAFIGSNIPYGRRGRAIGIVEMSWSGAALVGIPLIGLVFDRWGVSASFFCFAFFGVLGWVGMMRFLPPDVKKSDDSGSVSVFSSMKQLVRIRPALGMIGFGFWISIANDALFVTYGAWFENVFHLSLVALGFSTAVIGAAELCGESLAALFADRLGLKRATVIAIILATAAYLLLPLVGKKLPFALAGMFMVFLCFEFTMICGFSLCSEVLPHARATMMAGFYAMAGVGRMIGVFTGAILWKAGGILAVTWSGAILTCVGLLCLFWGLRGWKAGAAVR